MARTEELGLAARLPIVVGGEQVELRTLNLDESEKWQAKLADGIAGFDIPESNDPSVVFAALAKQPTKVMLELVTAYDVGKVLGTPASLRKRITQRELYAAVKQMVSAEAPFVTDARSVVEAFGPQLRALAATMLERVVNRSQQANSTNGRSLTGQEPTPTLSVVGGSPKNVS